MYYFVIVTGASKFNVWGNYYYYYYYYYYYFTYTCTLKQFPFIWNWTLVSKTLCYNDVNSKLNRKETNVSTNIDMKGANSKMNKKLKG